MVRRDCLGRLDLRFDDVALEKAFAASMDMHRLKVLCVISAGGAMVGAFRIGSVIRREVEREEAPLIFGTDDPRTWFVVLRVLLVALSAIVLPIALAKCRCRRLQWLPTEVLCSAYIPTAMLTLVATQRGNVALLASNSVWAAEYRDAGAQEAITMVSIGVGLGWSKLLRSDRLAAILLGTILAYILPMFAEGFSSEPFEEAGLLGLTFAFVGNTAHNLESFTRGEFRKGHQVVEQQTQLGTQSALASGMQAIAERLCDLVFALDSQLVVCEQATAVDSFFGRPMFGVCLTAVLDDRDMQRTRDAFREASQSMIPQCLCVTLSTGARRLCEARLLVTDTGNEPQRFIAGVSIDHEQHAELSEIGAELAPFARVERSMPIGDLETSSMGTAHIFETQPLDIIAELGRKEHWWIEASDLEAPKPTRILGEGGFGIVVVARLHGQTVAAKTLRDPDGRGAARLRSFCLEIRAIRRARHPHIAAFLGATSNDDLGSVLLVYELIMGARFDDFARSLARSDRERFQVAFQVCSALCYLHAMRPAVVHGDLKASNVLVEQRSGPHARIIDFGLSRILSPTAPKLGVSLAWASPEVILGHRQPSTSVDVFGFGWLLFLAMTGGLPYGGAAADALQAAMREWLHAQCVPPLPMPADAPWQEETADLCRRCLHFRPEDRPSIGVVLESLQAWGTARCIAQRLDGSTASALLQAVPWHKIAGELQCRARLIDTGCEEVQVDCKIDDEGTLRITHVIGDSPMMGQDAVGTDICRYSCCPEGFSVSLCSILNDVRSGARKTPLLQELAGVLFNHAADDDRVLPVRLRAFVPDATGLLSVKVGWNSGEIRQRQLSL
mmetsp:Transcript_51777/g.149271  ORF Transcript_51777/g.149271 Transcript_51777/m.149271 type:complete len:843 (-) Transcript_51777:251-2779(-)